MGGGVATERNEAVVVVSGMAVRGDYTKLSAPADLTVVRL